ncbi:MAG: sigma-70 family RNA polymerase sigma factor [Bacteroidetes bacterium]|nr:sigma-70 family RNA polymerase sigma factor [Bacteroidota bacterium]
MYAGNINIAIPAEAMAASPHSMDSVLIDRCAEGDILAFRELYDRWKSPLFSLAYRFHGNREDAEDSLQDAFVHMYRSIGSFRRDAKFETWMYRIVMNACISAKRPRRAGERGVDFTDEARHPAAEDPGADVAMQGILEEEISGLPELQRAVFLLYASQNMTHPEIADVMHIGVGTSKSYYHRARTSLKQRLAQRGIHTSETEQ